VFANAAVHAQVGKLLKEELPGSAIGKGDEGAWVAPLDDETALALVAQVCREAGDEHGFPVRAALDVAASELWNGKAYAYRKGQRSTKEQLAFLAEMAQEHGLFSVEDPFHEEDFDSFAELTARIGEDTLVVTDDLTTTNPERLQRAIDQGAGNALLVKVNQIGTLSRAVEAIRMAHHAGWATIVSHRSGETTDDTIAHLAVAFGCLGLKSGAVGGERIAKLNELVRIEELVEGQPPEPSPERVEPRPLQRPKAERATTAAEPRPLQRPKAERAPGDSAKSDVTSKRKARKR
jgi:enolase